METLTHAMQASLASALMVPTTRRKHEGPTLAFLDSPAPLQHSRTSTMVPSSPSLQLCFRKPVEGKHRIFKYSTTSNINEGTLKEQVDLLYKQSTVADAELYVHLLRLCGESMAFPMGIQVHDHIVSNGLDNGIFLSNLMIQMYGKCKAIQQARSAFDQMHQRTVYSWNLMILSYIHMGEVERAFGLFQDMYCLGEELNEVTLITVLNACVNEGAVANGRFIHSCAVEYGFESDVVLGTATISMYGRCKCMPDAERAFDRLHEPDVVAWNSIIGLHIEQDQLSGNAFKVYKQMQGSKMPPDYVTFVHLLEACAGLADVVEGRLTHVAILDTGLEGTVKVGNALVNMYSKCGSFEDANKEFQKMQTRDVVSWNTIISAYTQYGFSQEAITLYKQMLQLGFKPDDFTYSSVISACAGVSAVLDGACIHSIIVDEGRELDKVIATALIDMYSKCHSLEDARKVFDQNYPGTMPSWTVMIGAYTLQGNGVEALELFQQMKLLGLKPDEITFASVLGACAILADLNEGKVLHEQIRKLGYESEVVVAGALVNMYGKCGSLTDAQNVFDGMSEHDLISWNALITAYTQQGCGEIALELFSRMQAAGVEPNEVTFVSVLSACSHARLVDEGVRLFDSMQHIHALTPTVEHYGCMVDLYGRAGYLKEAEDVIKSMPFESDSVVWETLLSACRMYGDVEQGKRAAEHAIQLKSNNDAPFILLSNIYAAEGRWEDVAKVRKRMADLGVKRTTGFSSIEVNNKIHKFVARDGLHPHMDEIYQELEKLGARLKEAGYVPDTRMVLYDVDEELKEHLLWYHSEKLAVTFGLLKTPPGTPLRIIKNLRVCQDCHSAFKIISKVACREITMRDANRFHIFSNGLCSCKDYW
ncbi:hypothetical protein L7F22_046001 [Adiantum nelumboides]|nr:hypothetical protein [Adiantum nelumboides]